MPFSGLERFQSLGIPRFCTGEQMQKAGLLKIRSSPSWEDDSTSEKVLGGTSQSGLPNPLQLPEHLSQVRFGLAWCKEGAPATALQFVERVAPLEPASVLDDARAQDDARGG